MANSVTLFISLYGTCLLKTAVVKSQVYEVTFTLGGGCENCVKASGELQKWCFEDI